LKQAADTIKEVSKFTKLLNKLTGKREVTATGVPPTGAEFSGDKWPGGKNPAEVELRAKDAGSAKFNKDKVFEDKRPNPAVDHRLDTTEYTRDDTPYVNASFRFNEGSPFESFWDIKDTKVGKRIVASFLNTPSTLGKKTQAALKYFSGEEYGKKIIDNILRVQAEKDSGKRNITGIDYIKNQLNAEYIGKSKSASLDAEARDPKVKDKAKIRRYYKDAYGDAEYARELTSKKKDPKAKVAMEGEGGSNDDMDVEYKPDDEHPKDKNEGEQKDGTGTISSVDPEIVKAKARKAVELAKLYASRGSIPFTKEAIYTKAKEFMNISDQDYSVRESTLKELPVVNENALKLAHIPDTEVGISGNKAEGVRDPKAAVKTDGLEGSPKTDAKISKQSSIVPQVSSEVEGKAPEVSSFFTTTEKRLRDKGINVQGARLRYPRQIRHPGCGYV